MNIAITGHSKGIGLELYHKFLSKGHYVNGFSRSNGYDIDNSKCRKAIIDESVDCDIFINNAWSPFSQTRMLEEIISSWKDTDKLIVNISSKASFLEKEKNYVKGIDFLKDNQYSIDKKNQNEIIKKYMLENSGPRLLNIILGMVDTELSKDLDCPKINPVYLADYIDEIISLGNRLMIQEVILDAPGIDYTKIKKVVSYTKFH